MRKNIWPTVVGMMLTLVSCDKIELREFIEDRYVPQPMDTVKVVNNYYLDGYESHDNLDTNEGVQLAAVNLFHDGNELYVANYANKSVDVFNIDNFTYQRSIRNQERTEARDVYAEGDHLFVAAGKNREVQIFNKKTGEYLTRLGTGNWSTSNVSWAGCVCATPQFVFVRDSKETNIRVFDREAIDLKAENNNKVFSKLTTGGDFIGSKIEPMENSYDMEVIGDSLYAFIPNSGTIYAWSVADIANNKDAAQVVVSKMETTKIRSIAKTDDANKFFVSIVINGKMQLAEYSLLDIQTRNFNSPIRCFVSDTRVSLPAQPIVAYHNEHLIITNTPKLERWEIRNNPSYEIVPFSNGAVNSLYYITASERP